MVNAPEYLKSYLSKPGVLLSPPRKISTLASCTYQKILGFRFIILMCTAGSVTPTYATVGIKRVGLNRKLVEPCQHLRLRTPDYHLHKFTNEFGFYAVSP